jgi:hypothetical protein
MPYLTGGQGPMLPPAGPCPWPWGGSAATASKTSASTTTSGSARAGGGTTPGRRHRPFFGPRARPASPEAGENPIPHRARRPRGFRGRAAADPAPESIHPGWGAACPARCRLDGGEAAASPTLGPGPRVRRGPQIRPTARRADQQARSAPLCALCATSASLAAKLQSPTDTARRDRDQPPHRLGMTLEPQPPALLSPQPFPRREMHHGAFARQRRRVEQAGWWSPVYGLPEGPQT